MGKLSLVIADTDEHYVKSLENYIMIHYSQRFDLYSFTTPEYLADFLEKSLNKVDVLLFDPCFFSGLIPLHKIDVPIGLVVSDMPEIPGGIKAIHKFQHVEKLISDIFYCYSQKSGGNFLPSGRNDTLITAVFSPIGGSGKTSIAAGCSVLCARRGLKVFYLNLEAFPSTSYYFNGCVQQSFSNVIYYLKEKGNNLSLKIEGAGCIDPDCKVHFFLPPDSAMEMNELLPEDITLLLRQFRNASQYDAVFIDMSSGLNPCNIELLKACDVIVQVCLHEAASGIKAKMLSSELDILMSRGSLDSNSRKVTVLNKYRGDFYRRDEEDGTDSSFHVIINECEELKHATVARQLAGVETAFSVGLGKLLEHILPERGGNGKRTAGGAVVG